MTASALTLVRLPHHWPLIGWLIPLSTRMTGECWPGTDTYLGVMWCPRHQDMTTRVIRLRYDRWGQERRERRVIDTSASVLYTGLTDYHQNWSIGRELTLIFHDETVANILWIGDCYYAFKLNAEAWLTRFQTDVRLNWMRYFKTDTGRVLLFTFRFTMQSLQIPDRNIYNFYSPRTVLEWIGYTISSWGAPGTPVWTVGRPRPRRACQIPGPPCQESCEARVLCHVMRHDMSDPRDRHESRVI